MRSASAAGIGFLVPDAVSAQLARGELKAVALRQTEAQRVKLATRHYRQFAESL